METYKETIVSSKASKQVYSGQSGFFHSDLLNVGQ